MSAQPQLFGVDCSKEVLSLMPIARSDPVPPSRPIQKETSSRANLNKRGLEVSDSMVDMVHRQFFCCHHVFHVTPSLFADIWSKISPHHDFDFGHATHDYMFRKRHPGCMIEWIKKIDKPSDYALDMFWMMNGCTHCVSRREVFLKNFVAFSIECCVDKQLDAGCQWFEEVLRGKSTELIPSHPTEDENSSTWSNVFDQLLDRPEGWFVMKQVDGGVNVVPLAGEDGLDNPELKRKAEQAHDDAKQHGLAAAISQTCQGKYITLFVWKFDVDSEKPRVYVDWDGFRLNLNATSDVEAIITTLFEEEMDSDVKDVVVSGLRDLTKETGMIETEKAFLEAYMYDAP